MLYDSDFHCFSFCSGSTNLSFHIKACSLYIVNPETYRDLVLRPEYPRDYLSPASLETCEIYPQRPRRLCAHTATTYVIDFDSSDLTDTLQPVPSTFPCSSLCHSNSKELPCSVVLMSSHAADHISGLDAGPVQHSFCTSLVVCLAPELGHCHLELKWAAFRS